MMSVIRSSIVRTFIGGLTSLFFAVAGGQVQVTTFHNNMARTGLNSSETLLTTRNVNPDSFGLLFSQRVDGQVYAQPLYLSNVTIPGKGNHNVVYVCTEHNSVYAFDADSNSGSNAQPLWQINLGPSVPSADTFSALITLEKGITSTPVIINLPTPILYVECFNKTLDTRGNPVYSQMLHALDATTGKEKLGGPVAIGGSVPGTGDGSVNGTVTFHPLWQLSRSALLYVPRKTVALRSPSIGKPFSESISGTIYVAFGSHGDYFPYHGWMFAYDAATLKLLGIINTGPNSKTSPSGYPIAGAGIWQGASGPASDGTNIFFSTGNGMFDPTIGSFGDSILRFQDRVFSIGDYFTPSTQEILNDYNGDLGAGGVMLLPKEVNAPTGPDLLVQAGKEGTMYLLDRNHLGQYRPNDSAMQELPHAINAVRGAPAYFNGNIYYAPCYSPLVTIPIRAGRFTMSGPSSSSASKFKYVGPTPSISSNGSKDGIVWSVANTKAFLDTRGILYAYDASDLGVELYNSGSTFGRDTIPQAIKFSTPTIANGKVYVGTASSISIFGLGSWPKPPRISVASGRFENPVTVTVSASDAPNMVTYTTDGSVPTRFSTRYRGPVTLSSSASFKARSFSDEMRASAVAEANYLIKPLIGSGIGLRGEYSPTTGNRKVTRIDRQIDFVWKKGAPTDTDSGRWSGTWTGTIQPLTSGPHTFSIDLDSSAVVWIDGQVVIDNSAFNESPSSQGSVSLRAGVRYTIQIKYTSNGGDSSLRLFWTAPGLATELVPMSQLYPD